MAKRKNQKFTSPAYDEDQSAKRARTAEGAGRETAIHSRTAREVMRDTERARAAVRPEKEKESPEDRAAESFTDTDGSGGPVPSGGDPADSPHVAPEGAEHEASPTAVEAGEPDPNAPSDAESDGEASEEDEEGVDPSDE